MPSPSFAYRDPALVVERNDTHRVRRDYGCAACRHRGSRLFNRTLCARGNQPGRGGYCRAWDLDADWHKPGGGDGPA